MTERSVQIVTGRAFSLSLVTVGQGNFTVPSSVRVGLDSHFQLDPAQDIQNRENAQQRYLFLIF